MHHDYMLYTVLQKELTVHGAQMLCIGTILALALFGNIYNCQL